jgi:hypothetical protein
MNEKLSKVKDVDSNESENSDKRGSEVIDEEL